MPDGNGVDFPDDVKELFVSERFGQLLFNILLPLAWFGKKRGFYAHSQQIYLLDRAGRTRAFFFTGTPVDEMQGAVLALLQEPATGEDLETEVVEWVIERDPDSAD